MNESINIRPFLIDFFNGQEFYSAPSDNPFWIEAAQQIIRLKIDFGKELIKKFDDKVKGKTFVFSLDDLNNNFVILTGKIGFN